MTFTFGTSPTASFTIFQTTSLPQYPFASTTGIIGGNGLDADIEGDYYVEGEGEIISFDMPAGLESNVLSFSIPASLFDDPGKMAQRIHRGPRPGKPAFKPQEAEQTTLWLPAPEITELIPSIYYIAGNVIPFSSPKEDAETPATALNEPTIQPKPPSILIPRHKDAKVVDVELPIDSELAGPLKIQDIFRSFDVLIPKIILKGTDTMMPRIYQPPIIEAAAMCSTQQGIDNIFNYVRIWPLDGDAIILTYKDERIQFKLPIIKQKGRTAVLFTDEGIPVFISFEDPVPEYKNSSIIPIIMKNQELKSVRISNVFGKTGVLISVGENGFDLPLETLLSTVSSGLKIDPSQLTNLKGMFLFTKSDNPIHNISLKFGVGFETTKLNEW